MERKSIWKNFLILTIGSLIVFHVDMAGADEGSTQPTADDEGCVLTTGDN